MKQRKWWHELHPDLEEQPYRSDSLTDVLDDETVQPAYRQGIFNDAPQIDARKEKIK